MPLPRLNDEERGNVEAELELQRKLDDRARAREERRRKAARVSPLVDADLLERAGLGAPATTKESK